MNHKIKEILELAVETNILSIKCVYVLALEHGENYDDLLNDIAETAHLQRHWNKRFSEVYEPINEYIEQTNGS